MVEKRKTISNGRLTYEKLGLEFQNTQDVARCQFKKYACFIDYISESARILMKNIEIELSMPTPLYGHPWDF